MTKKQKKEYFEKMNKSFKEKLAKAPQRKSKTKKILKFKNCFEIKSFDEKKKVVEVSKTKNIYENYKADIHFSWNFHSYQSDNLINNAKPIILISLLKHGISRLNYQQQITSVECSSELNT